jgi:DNA-binding NarL/FixJ family response regulator
MRQIIKNPTKPSRVRKATVRVAVIDSDPLRFVGFRELLSSQSDFDLRSVSLSEIGTYQEVDVVLIGSHPGKSIIEMLTAVKTLRPSLDIIVTGCNVDDAAILKAVSAGAKGYVEESASSGELVQAIRIVLSGSVWAPRRVLAVHKPGKGGTRDAGGRVLQQGNRGSSRDRRAHGESARGQTFAKSWSFESSNALSACHHAFVGRAQRELTQAPLPTGVRTPLIRLVIN